MHTLHCKVLAKEEITVRRKPRVIPAQAADAGAWRLVGLTEGRMDDRSRERRRLHSPLGIRLIVLISESYLGHAGACWGMVQST